ncbi:MAG: phosphate ABC transporter ATP-binding protein PstB [Candidatus Firestonebacteria bacterium]
MEQNTGKIIVKNLNAYFGDNHVLKNINITFPEKKVTAVIGPSGCGKSTLIRCINRMHEVVLNARVEGEIFLDGENIYPKYIKDVEPIEIRRKVGMVFQRPNPFPTLSIYDNVAAGLKLNGVRNKTLLDEIVVNSLKDAGLWKEVEHKLNHSGVSLSGGQQQRLCIARALAVKPEVVLFDEPCSALDPISTAKIEELMFKLKEKHTIIIVTHNIPQAGRVSDYTAFLYLGDLIEFDKTEKLLTMPTNKMTEKYLTGKFG